APTGDKLAFGVDKGTKLTKHFETTVEFEKRKASLSVGENELPAELTERIEMKFSFKNELEVEDEYLEIDGARTQKLARTFRTASESSDQHIVMVGAEPKDEHKDLESPLVGHTVAFTWNDKDEKYAKRFQSEKGE